MNLRSGTKYSVQMENILAERDKSPHIVLSDEFQPTREARTKGSKGRDERKSTDEETDTSSYIE